MTVHCSIFGRVRPTEAALCFLRIFLTVSGKDLYAFYREHDILVRQEIEGRRRHAREHYARKGLIKYRMAEALSLQHCSLQRIGVSMTVRGNLHLSLFGLYDAVHNGCLQTFERHIFLQPRDSSRGNKVHCECQIIRDFSYTRCVRTTATAAAHTPETSVGSTSPYLPIRPFTKNGPGASPARSAAAPAAIMASPAGKAQVSHPPSIRTPSPASSLAARPTTPARSPPPSARAGTPSPQLPSHAAPEVLGDAAGFPRLPALLAMQREREAKLPTPSLDEEQYPALGQKPGKANRDRPGKQNPCSAPAHAVGAASRKDHRRVIVTGLPVRTASALCRSLKQAFGPYSLVEAKLKGIDPRSAYQGGHNLHAVVTLSSPAAQEAALASGFFVSGAQVTVSKIGQRSCHA